MTTTNTDARPHPAATALPVGSTCARQLRGLIGADATICVLSGVSLIVATGPISDLIGLATTGPARLVGAFLVLLGVALTWLSVASDEARLRWVPVSAAGDITWAVASLAVAVLADLTGPGRALIALQGLLVLGVGEAKLVLHRRARAES